MNENITVGKKSKLLKHGGDKLKNSASNKLKNYLKIDIKKDLLFNKPKEISYDDYAIEELNNRTNKGINKGVDLGIRLGKKVITSKVGAYVLIGALIFMVLINIFSGVASIISTTTAAKPDINEENAIKIKQLMESLDKDCGQKLISGFTISGSTDTDWKTALALLLGYYENDLTDFNETIGGSWSGQFADIINKESQEHGVNPFLIAAIIKCESDFIPTCTSPVGAKGLMQLMPSNCQELGVTDPYDPQQNICGGTREILSYLNYWSRKGKTGEELLKLSLASYNAGLGNVLKYGGVPPFAETRNYVIKVPNQFREYSGGNTEPFTASMGNSKLSEIYYKINEVSVDHKTLKRHNFDEVIEQLNFTDEQKETATLIYEADLWADVFDSDMDYSFNITGSYINNSSVDMSNLSEPRKRIVELATSLLGKPYLWGGRCYNYNCPPEQVSNMDCSGFTGYVMAKVFGATYYNGPPTYDQRDFYCYQVPEEEAKIGDIVFNGSCSHTLIYFGKNESGENIYCHSPQTGDVIKISTYPGRVVNFWRLKGVNYGD